MSTRAGYDNIKDENDNRTPNERREMAIIAGKASGEARRKKANFRKTLNLLLTTKIDNPELTPMLEEAGVDSTLESVLNMAIIKKGLSGDVAAYNAICKVIQTEEEIKHKNNELEKQRIEIEKQKAEIEKQKLEIEKMRIQMQGSGAEEYESDGFMDALKASASDILGEGEEFIETEYQE